MYSHLEAELEMQQSCMYRVALRLVGSPEEALDVVQTASLKAWRNAERFDRRSTVATWLHRITVNVAMDLLRRRQRAPHRSLEQIAEKHIPDTQLQTLENREMFLLALQYIEKLPDDCRDAFVLTQLDGYSYQEAAEILGIPQGTVGSKIYRAKKILARSIQEHCE